MLHVSSIYVDISFDSSHLRSPLSNCSHGGAYALLPFSSFFRLRRVPRSVSNLPSRRSLACLFFGYRRFSPTFSFSVPSPLPLSLDYLFSWKVSSYLVCVLPSLDFREFQVFFPSPVSFMEGVPHFLCIISILSAFPRPFSFLSSFLLSFFPISTSWRLLLLFFVFLFLSTSGREDTQFCLVSFSFSREWITRTTCVFCFNFYLLHQFTLVVPFPTEVNKRKMRAEAQLLIPLSVPSAGRCLS